jgi:hypothetical protein
MFRFLTSLSLSLSIVACSEPNEGVEYSDNNKKVIVIDNLWTGNEEGIFTKTFYGLPSPDKLEVYTNDVYQKASPHL